MGWAGYPRYWISRKTFQVVGTRYFTGQMPFLPYNQQCQITLNCVRLFKAITYNHITIQKILVIKCRWYKQAYCGYAAAIDFVSFAIAVVLLTDIRCHQHQVSHLFSTMAQRQTLPTSLCLCRQSQMLTHGLMLPQSFLLLPSCRKSRWHHIWNLASR